MYETLIRGGWVVDGTGGQRCRADMAIGNGRIGANIFIEDDNATLGLLIASQEAFSESGELIKIGWIRVKILPLPTGTLAEQRLDVLTATYSANWTGGVPSSWLT